MYIDYYFEELLKKFKSELEREENYISDGFFAPIKELNHLEISDEVYDLCDCAWEEIKKEPSKEEYLDILKEKYEEYIRTPLLKLIDEVYYYSDNVIPLHNKEKRAIGIFLKPANECSENFINEHQAIKTYRYHLQSIGKDVACNYAIEAISEIWNKIEKAVKHEIKKQGKRNTSNQIPQKGINLPEKLNTDEAKKWLKVAIDGGLLNSDYSPTDKTATKPQKALLADILSEKIGLEYKYKPFETLWNVRGLSKQRYKSREEIGTVKEGDVITEVFRDK